MRMFWSGMRNAILNGRALRTISHSMRGHPLQLAETRFCQSLKNCKPTSLKYTTRVFYVQQRFSSTRGRRKAAWPLLHIKQTPRGLAQAPHHGGHAEQRGPLDSVPLRSTEKPQHCQMMPMKERATGTQQQGDAAVSAQKMVKAKWRARPGSLLQLRNIGTFL